MTPLLKGLLGNGSKDRELADEMRALLQEMQEERGRFEALLQTVHASAERLQRLGEPIAKVGSDADAVAARLGELERRFEAMLHLAQRFETLDERADALAQGQRHAESHIARVSEEVQGIRAVFDELSQKVDVARDLKDRIESFMNVEKPFQQLRESAEAVRGHVDGTAEQLARLREQHGRLMDAHKLSVSKMEALDLRHEVLSRDLQDRERRVANVEQAVRRMDGVQDTVDGVKREMVTLKALGEFVAQKSAALEAQREAVESALARADHLDRAMRQIDAGVRQQQENERMLGTLEERVAALRTLHETVVERSHEIAQLQRQVDEQAQASRQELAAVRDEMKNTVERFDFERKGLEFVSQRVTDLRSTLSDFENRFKGVSESSQIVGELKSQTQALAAHLQGLTAEVGRVDDEVEKLRAIRRDLDEIAGTARDAGLRMGRIEESRPALEAAVRDLAQLASGHAMVRDALEQVQLAHGEIARARENHAETRTWLAAVEQSLADVREQVDGLRELAPTVEQVQKQAQRTRESMAAIESRREFVEELQRRMADLGSLGGALEERGRQLQARMEAAEQRFVGLAAHAEEAERMSQTVAAVTSSVQEAAREAAEIGKTVAAVEARCEAVEELADRTRSLQQELDQRQRALQDAAKDLQRASKLRQEAAASVQQLDEQAKRLVAAISSAERRAEQVGTLSTQLEDRAAGLDAVKERLDEFEQRLVKWELVEQEIARSLEQISARQGTVESLKADLDRMFVMAEKTATDVRAITSAHREIEESRRLLEDVMGRLREVRETASSLDERKRQIAKAEERLARAEALLVDVRSGLEALEGQRAVVDQAVAKAGSLRSLLKQAEAMIESLREERMMTAQIRAAVAAVRREDDDGRGEELAEAA